MLVLENIITDRGSRYAVAGAPCTSEAEAKALVRRLGARIDDAVVAETVEMLMRRWESPEAEEGIAAFFGKRKPGWAEG